LQQFQDSLACRSYQGRLHGEVIAQFSHRSVEQIDFQQGLQFVVKITWGGQVREKLLHLSPNEYQQKQN
jgi:hypothetical protein